MDFNSQLLYPLFEKSLIRITADFESNKDPRSAVSELSLSLKSKVSSEEPSSYNFKLKRTEDGVYHLTTPFLLYRDSRLVIINLLKWIQRNGKTDINSNFFLDIKFMDQEKGPFKGTLLSTATKIDNLDKFKFILEFDEESIYKSFPSRKNYFLSQSIENFEPTNKFLSNNYASNSIRSYQVPNTSNCGINFEHLTEGFLRMQYIGGTRYEDKIEDILTALNKFCAISWDSTINRQLTQKNISKFEKIVEKNKKIRESYYDFLIFQKNYPKIKFTVDLVDNKKSLDTYYQALRERIYEILINLDSKKGFELNYDSSLSTFQIKDGDLTCKNINGVEFIQCTIKGGSFTKTDFYNCEVTDSYLTECNLFLDSKANRCILFNSFSNRTSELLNCDVSGMSGVLNAKMEGGIFRNGKIGLFASISKSTKVIEYQKLKTGYVVAGDQIIIPTKKFRQL
jgi:hypothetical protein